MNTNHRGLSDPKVLYPLLANLDQDDGVSLTYEQKQRLLKTPYVEKLDQRRPIALRRTKRGESVIQLMKGWDRKKLVRESAN